MVNKINYQSEYYRAKLWNSFVSGTSLKLVILDRSFRISHVYNNKNVNYLRGKLVFDFVEKQHIGLYKKALKSVFQKGKSTKIRVSAIKNIKEKIKIWYEIEIIPILNNEEKIDSFLVSTRNISEEIKSEIDKTKLSLDIILSQSPALIWTTDKNLVITSSHGSGLKDLGLKPNEITGKSLYDLLGVSDKKFLPIKSHLEALKGKRVQYERAFANNHYQSFVEPLLQSKKIIGCIGVSFNITQIKKTEQELKEKERTLSTLMNNLPGMVYRCAIDKHRTMYFVSRGCYDLTEYTEKELVVNSKISYEEIIFDQDRKIVRSLVNKAVKLKKHFELQYRIRTKSGKQKWVWERGEGIFSQTGKLLFIEGFITDITNNKEIELKIKSSENNYRRLVEASPDGVFIHDENGYVVFANPSCLRTMGIKNINELKNRSIFHYVLPEYHSMIKKRRDDFQKGEDLPFIRIRIRNATGNILEVESKPISFIFEGKKAVLVVYHDLTKQRRLEKEHIRLQMAEEHNIHLQQEIGERKKAEKELKQSLNEKDILLKEVHHRVKNNLQVVSSILNLQSSYIKDEYTVNMFKESQNRIKAMAFIHELLYQTKNFSKINFSDYITNITRNLIQSYSHHYVKLNVNIDSVYMNIDTAIPCGLIINEVISNSLKYAFNKQGSDDAEISIDIKENDKKIEMKISDNGVGLPQEFDYKQSNTLGMQLIHTLAEQLSAKINLTNKNGTGYTIIFNNQQN